MAPSVVSRLRDVVPLRPLRRDEAFRIAELQASRFRQLAPIGPLLPESAIADLPRIEVHRLDTLPVSGATAWSDGRWQIILRGREPWARQRFSLAHEFKHILDHRFIGIVYEGIPKGERADFIEHVCDYFAGCLLIPRTALKTAWTSGLQSPSGLARRFGASVQAVETRLAQTGLVGPRTRCATGTPLTLPFSTAADSSSASYQRQSNWIPVLVQPEGVPS